MIITKKHLHRRTFLRGLAGVTLGLPLLDAMIPALGAQTTAAKSPFRATFVYSPHGIGGVGLDNWVPKATGTGYEISPMLRSLAPLKDRFIVFSNFATNKGRQAGSGHAAASSTFLSCAQIKDTNGDDVRAGQTIDQMIAQKIGQETPMPSMELGIEDISNLVGACDGTSSCHYLNTMSWRDDTTPLPAEIDPRALFERMFGDGSSPEMRAHRLQTDRSLLDSITKSAAQLQSKVGAQDKTRISDYLDNLREIERRIAQVEKRNSDAVLAVPDSPAGGIPELYPDHVNLMFDLQLVALQADITRVTTFMMSRELNNRSYPHIGVPEQHHTVSHHQNNPVLIQKLEQIATHHVELFSGFLDRMSKIQDGDGTLLDHTMVMYGSGLGNPNVHSRDPISVILAGGAHGQIKGGRHIRNEASTPMANLLLTMLAMAGVEREKIGDSTGPLTI